MLLQDPSKRFFRQLVLCLAISRSYIKALLLRRKNDYFGDASAAFRQAAMAAAIEEERGPQ